MSVDGSGRPIVPVKAVVSAAVAGGRRRGLGQAIALDDGARRCAPATCRRRPAARPCRRRWQTFRRGEVDLVEVRVVEQRVVQRVHGREHVDLVLAQLLDEARRCRAGSGSAGSVAPTAHDPAAQHTVSAKMWYSGSARDDDDLIDWRRACAARAAIHASVCSTLATTLRCSSVAPLDTPVVPPVYCRKATSSGFSSTGLSGSARPRASAVVEADRSRAATRPAPSSSRCAPRS